LDYCFTIITEHGEISRWLLVGATGLVYGIWSLVKEMLFEIIFNWATRTTADSDDQRNQLLSPSTNN